LDALKALPLFVSVRAAIRAKVTAARRVHVGVEQASIARSARQYFAFACQVIVPASPVLIAVGGRSGTGKSALARRLGPSLPPVPGAVVVRSDVERKRMFGCDEHARLPANAYAPAVTARVYAAVAEKAHRVIAAGHSAIADAVFAQPQERALLAQAAQ